MTYKFMKFCPEHYMEIENYELAKADNFKGWVCHHRNGLEFSREWLIKNNMYWNRKDPHEFKFMKFGEHTILHHTGKVAWNKGKSSWNKGKHLSPEHRKHLSDAIKAQRAKENGT